MNTTCPECNGEGGWEHETTSGDHFEGAAWEPCQRCGGEGTVKLCGHCEEPVDMREARKVGGEWFCPECFELLEDIWAHEDYADAVAGEEY